MRKQPLSKRDLTEILIALILVALASSRIPAATAKDATPSVVETRLGAVAVGGERELHRAVSLR